MAITLQVDYGLETTKDCSGTLFEIPTTDVIGGDVLEIRVWGMGFSELAPYSLQQGTKGLGRGSNKQMPLNDINESTSFFNSNAASLLWSCSTLESVIANGAILNVTSGFHWCEHGDDITSKITANGSALSAIDGTTLSGVVNVVYRSSQDVEELVDFAETSEFQATYPIYSIGNITAIGEIVKLSPDETIVSSYAGAGTNITGNFSRKGYSCIKELTSTPLYGPALLQYTRSPFYKQWEWPVPVNDGGTYWFFIMKGGIATNKFAIELPDLTEGVVESRNISLRVVSRDGSVPLIGAQVYIDELYRGVTDSLGILLIDGITTGSHPLRVVMEGFLSTDEDNLFNDTLEVY